MRVSYRTFTGISSYTANVANFRDLISDIRRQLNIDGESRVMIACGGKVFREPHASLEAIVAIGKLMVVRYELSKTALEQRRKDRKIVKVARNSGSGEASASSSSSSAPPLLDFLILDDCSPASLVTANPFNELFRHGRHHEPVNIRDVEHYSRRGHLNFSENMQRISQSLSNDPAPTFGRLSGSLVGGVTGSVTGTSGQTAVRSVLGGVPRLSLNPSIGGSMSLEDCARPDNVAGTPSSVNVPERFNGVDVNPDSVDNASRADLISFSNAFENNQWRIVASLLERESRSNAVTVEDEKEEEAKEEEEYSEVSNEPMNATPGEIAVIAAAIADSESAWEVFRRGPIPRPFDMMDDTFIRGIRRHPDNLRALVSSLLASNPQIIRRMMLAVTDSSDSENSDDEPEEHVQSPRPPHRRINISEDNQNNNSSDSSENDSDDESVNNNDIETPSLQNLISLLAEMMHVSRDVAIQALRQNNFDQNAAIDFIMNRAVPDVPAAVAALLNSSHSVIMQIPDAAVSQRNRQAIPRRSIDQREPRLIRSSVLSHRQGSVPNIHVRMNVAPAAPYNEGRVMEEVD
jgi:hypothetical protein